MEECSSFCLLRMFFTLLKFLHRLFSLRIMLRSMLGCWCHVVKPLRDFPRFNVSLAQKEQLICFWLEAWESFQLACEVCWDLHYASRRWNGILLSCHAPARRMVSVSFILPRCSMVGVSPERCPLRGITQVCLAFQSCMELLAGDLAGALLTVSRHALIF
jgi:hypothetical protein